MVVCTTQTPGDHHDLKRVSSVRIERSKPVNKLKDAIKAKMTLDLSFPSMALLPCRRLITFLTSRLNFVFQL